MAGAGSLARTTALPKSLFAIVLIAACAQAASVAWPFDYIFAKGATLWWLQTLALAALCWVLGRCRSPKQAAVVGIAFATVWLSTTFWWLFVAMHTYAGLHPLLTVLAIVALAAALGLYYAAASAAFWSLSRNRVWLASLSFAALWIMAEMARGTWLTGFGWGAIGYAHIDGPLAWYAPWVGAYGLTAIAAWLAAVLASARHRSIGTLTAAVAALVLPLIIPANWNHWSEPTGSLSVTLLQGNIPQDEKFQPGSGVPLALQWYGEQLLASRGDLVVAPETAIPLLPQQLPEGYWAAVQNRFAAGGQTALIGIPLGNYNQGYTNSVIGLAPGQSGTWQYDKHHLVPFGEFIPPLFKWFTRMMNIPLGDFNRGAVGQPSLVAQGQRLAPNICYEDLFGEELGARFVDTSLAPTVFVNVSNIGWFGDTVAIDQHLHISRMRALEFERPFVRATNTGATVIMDHRAQVLAALPRHTRAVLTGEVQGRSGNTPFAWWVSRFGLWPVWLLAIAVCAFAAWRVRRGVTSPIAP
jgi:apolipoprotein N-acyltransferase